MRNEPRLEPAVPANQPPKEKNVILVGKKETMAYVLAVVTQFNQGQVEIHVKARGKSILKAADVTQIVQHRFIPSLVVKKVDIWTEDLTSEDGRRTKVTAMDFVLIK